MEVEGEGVVVVRGMEVRAEMERKLEVRNPTEWTPYQQQPLGLSRNDVQRRVSLDSFKCLNAEDTSSNGNKDDRDDDADDDNDDDKIDAQYDPERLKAFNMFVRLFVDENLDRIVPISKQPKEKIQAIIDACARQFPRFADRTIRGSAPISKVAGETRELETLMDGRRHLVPHRLTSPASRQSSLANACENEAQNAKRMRLGLEPIAQPNPLNPQPPTPLRLGYPTPPSAPSWLPRPSFNSVLATPPRLQLRLGTLLLQLRLGYLPSFSSVLATPPLLQLRLGYPPLLQLVGPEKPLSLVDTVVKTESNAPHVSALGKALERPMTDSKVMNGSSMFQASFQQSSKSDLTDWVDGPTDLSVKGTAKPTRPAPMQLRSQQYDNSSQAAASLRLPAKVGR
ncbi:Nucleolar protein 4-like [Homarus americanus]|uniref:Nucleolar protein 4-like n=1 Tax=Homarus americanus TaxID=6706 RepID=A0A8J5J992_HOMAM|nr:Nucleolar protein 4-like [Homarus americanus]